MKTFLLPSHSISEKHMSAKSNGLRIVGDKSTSTSSLLDFLHVCHEIYHRLLQLHV